MSDSLLKLGGPNGLVLVSLVADVDVRLENVFDTRRRKGHNVATFRFLGTKPAEISATFTLLDDDDEIAFWRDVAPLLRLKSKSASSPPIDIICAPVNRLGIKAIILKDSQIGPRTARDGRTVSIRMQEWAPSTTKAAPAAAPRASAGPSSLDAITPFTNG